MTIKRHVLLPRSSKQGSKPTADSINYGELTVNYAAGNEFLSTKNSNNEIVVFPSKNYLESQPFSSLTIDNLVINSGASISGDTIIDGGLKVSGDTYLGGRTYVKSGDTLVSIENFIAETAQADGNNYVTGGTAANNTITLKRKDLVDTTITGVVTTDKVGEAVSTASNGKFVHLSGDTMSGHLKVTATTTDGTSNKVAEYGDSSITYQNKEIKYPINKEGTFAVLEQDSNGKTYLDLGAPITCVDNNVIEIPSLQTSQIKIDNNTIKGIGNGLTINENGLVSANDTKVSSITIADGNDAGKALILTNSDGTTVSADTTIWMTSGGEGVDGNDYITGGTAANNTINLTGKGLANATITGVVTTDKVGEAVSTASNGKFVHTSGDTITGALNFTSQDAIKINFDGSSRIENLTGETSSQSKLNIVAGNDHLYYNGNPIANLADSRWEAGAGNSAVLLKNSSGSAVGEFSVSEGKGTTASGECSHAEGKQTKAVGVSSHAEGESTTASGKCSHAEGSGTTASGQCSHAEGSATKASGISSHAEGSATKASGISSHAEGNSTTASGISSHAEGNSTTASGKCSHAEGLSTTASGNDSHAEGYRTTASGSSSHAEGNQTKSVGESSHAEGESTTASGNYSHTEGYSTSASSDCSHAEGSGTIASGYGSHAEGYRTTASGAQSHAEGSGTIASGYWSHAEGQNGIAVGHVGHVEGLHIHGLYIVKDVTSGDKSITVYNPSNQLNLDYYKNCYIYDLDEWKTRITGASYDDSVEISDGIVIKFDVEDALPIDAKFADAEKENQSDGYFFTWKYSLTNIGATKEYAQHAEGKYTMCIGDASHAEGDSSMAVGNDSHAEGNGTIASGNCSHAEGASTEASGDHSHAEGLNTTASGNYSHVEGESNEASGNHSHAEGQSTRSSGDFSHAEGQGATASGIRSHAEGDSTSASGDSSHAEGRDAIASGECSHAEGNLAKAVGKSSHAEGQSTTASGNYSHAEGLSATAIGNCSHAEGLTTTASGNYSHAEGQNTTASGYCSHVEGIRASASGNCSHAEGESTTASGSYSHTEGNRTRAIGENSHAEGCRTTASGYSSHAEGYSTTASGSYSHAEGTGTTANGNYSHAEGKHTIAMNESEHACGSYNRSVSGSGQVFSVGAGTSDDNRVNTFYVKNDGTIGSDLDMSISGKSKITLSTVSDTLIMSGGTITTNCTMTTGAYFTTSDERLKSNIIGVTEDEIEKAKKVDLKSFNLKRDGKKHFGVVAQEVETAGLAELVNTDSEGMKSVDYTSLLILKIAELEKEIKDLKNQINNK